MRPPPLPPRPARDRYRAGQPKPARQLRRGGRWAVRCRGRRQRERGGPLARRMLRSSPSAACTAQCWPPVTSAISRIPGSAPGTPTA